MKIPTRFLSTKARALSAGRTLLPAALTALATGLCAAHAPAQSPYIESFCHGDGTATPCPCGNVGQPGRGCPNSMNPGGALLSATGNPFTDEDTLCFHVTGVPPTTSVFYRLATEASNGGMGVPWNDGLLCFTGDLVRLGSRAAVNGTSSFGFGVAGDPLISVRGLIPVTGGTRVVQCSYRNVQAFCTPGVMNTTNALQIQFAPKPPPYEPENLGANADASNGLIYIDVDTAVVDGGLLHGMRFNPTSNEWEVMQPILRFVNGYSLNTSPIFQGFTTRFRQFFNDVEQMSSNSVRANLSASIGLVKLAASLAMQSQTGSSSLSTGFSLDVEPEYASVIADLANPAHFEFTPLALSILNLPPAQRAAAWRDAFGNYVAVGFDFKGHLGAKVQLNQSSSFSDRSTVANLEAKYKTVEANVGIASLFHDAMSSTNLSIGYDTLGAIAPPLPTLAALSTPSGQAQFATDLMTAAIGREDDLTTPANEFLEGAHVKRGLFLLPVTSLPDARIPGSLAPLFDELVIGDATQKTAMALDVLRQVETIDNTYGFRAFLDAQFPPTAGASFGERLTSARSLLMTRFRVLWPAYRSYLIAEGADQASARAELLAAVGGVDEATLALGTLLNEIDEQIRTLPPIHTTATENFTPNSSAPGNSFWYTFDVQVRNVAIFTTPGLLDGESARQYLAQANTQAPDDSPIVIYHDLLGLYPVNYQVPNLRVVPNGLGEVLSATVTRITSGPSAGLCDLNFTFQAQINNMSSSARLKFKDMLGRENVLDMDDLDTASWHSN